MTERHKVVIIGGGFGGLYAAQSLRRAPVEVTLVDRRNFHLFQPLLYQVATGELSPSEVASPLRHILHRSSNTRVLLAEAADLDPRRRRLRLKDGEELPYDTLVVAAGSQNHYFGNHSWERYAPGLKTIEDATWIRHKILYAFEAAERETDPARRRSWLTFVIVGGGPTGVELAGALGEIANDVLKSDFRSIRPEESQILLVEAGDRLLDAYDAKLSRAAEKALIGLGVRAQLGTRVTAIDDQGITVQAAPGAGRIESRTVIWAAGVKGSAFGGVIAERTGAERDRGGRIIVTEDCSVPGYPEIFVIGDLANYRDETGKSLPGVAAVAMQQGRYVAGVIGKRLKGERAGRFHYCDKGSLAVIGRAEAVAQFGRFRFEGYVAWLLWLFVHLMYLVSFQNRLLVFIRWAYDYFTYSRGARLITGPIEEQGEATAPVRDVVEAGELGRRNT